MATQPGTIASAAPATRPTVSRIQSLDLVRGVVMVLMAIDHVRVYAGVPAGGPTAGIFLTRWVTHFCAPAFVFLAGTAAFLHGRKVGVPAVSRYLFTRGLALVVMEVTIIKLSWTFTVASLNFPLAGVIWMLGWCMVLLAGLVRFPARTVGAVGLAIVFLQQLFALVPRALPEGMRPGPGGRRRGSAREGDRSPCEGPVPELSGPPFFVRWSGRDA